MLVLVNFLKIANCMVLFTWVSVRSKKFSLPFSSVSTVNFMFGCMELIRLRKMSSCLDEPVKQATMSSTYLYQNEICLAARDVLIIFFLSWP